MSTNESSIMGVIKDTIDTKDENAMRNIKNSLKTLILKSKKSYEKIIIVNIGTNRCTGDSFAPILGHLLCKNKNIHNYCKIYGTLDSPVHAKNLEETINKIDLDNNLIIAIDACLGYQKNIGNIKLSNSSIKAGAGFDKKLPTVGDISIAGIVSEDMDDKNFNFMKLQNVRLNIVMNMAEIVNDAIIQCLQEIHNIKDNSTDNIVEFSKLKIQ